MRVLIHLLHCRDTEQSRHEKNLNFGNPSHRVIAEHGTIAIM